MFDNSKPNVIIISDFTDVVNLTKNLGPYKVAYELRQAGIETMVINHAHTWTLDELKYLLSNLISDQTLFIGFNTIFYHSIKDVIKDPNKPMNFSQAEPGAFLPHGRSVNKEIKDFVHSINPRVKFVIGGPTATNSEWNRDFDYVIFGYADQSIIKLARHLIDPTCSLGTSYRSVYGPQIIDDAKAPDFDFPNSTLSYQDHDAILPGETLSIEISRGCIFRCNFCSYPLNGKTKFDYIKHEELLYQEFLENYTRWGITRYIFSDDTFNDSEEKINMMWRISKRLPFKLEYWAYIRLDLLGAHLQVTDRLFESGLRSCYMGIESFNAKSARAIGKSGNKEKLLETLQYIKRQWGNEVSLVAGFIFGLPYEDLDSIHETIRLLESNEACVDSWAFFPMGIRDNISETTATHHSDIDKNYTKYGYKKIGSEGTYVVWENDYTNWYDMKTLAQEKWKNSIDNNLNKVDGLTALTLAGLGYDPNLFKNKPPSQVPWNDLFLSKLNRAQQYRDIIYQVQGIAPYPCRNQFPWAPDSSNS